MRGKKQQRRLKLSSNFNLPIIKAKEEPWLEDCKWCKGAHMAGTVHLCPLAKNSTQPNKNVRLVQS